MTVKSIAWILEFTSKLPNKEEKLKCLRANGRPEMLTILKYAFDPEVVWLLPPGAPPYTPSEEGNNEKVLWGEVRKLYHYIKGGNDNLNQIKRERMFIELLEHVAPEDAELLVHIKDKKLPFTGITARMVKDAFPGIFAND
jgi:hypothetical protein